MTPLEKVLKAQRAQEKAREAFLVSIEEAIEAGETRLDISEATGIARVQIWRWLSRREAERTTST